MDDLHHYPSVGGVAMEQQETPSCVLLVYKIPREPTSLRAMVWRRLKRLGALLVHCAVWLIPGNPWTREQMQWLAVEILELGGEAYVWEARELLVGQEQALVQQFQARVDTVYQEILAELDQDVADVLALSSKYLHTITQVYFHSALVQTFLPTLLYPS